MLPYPCASRDYLRRAKARLAEGTPEALFYAALEVRCGVEARLQEYLEPQKHVAAGEKKQWQVGKLSNAVTKAFKSDKVSRVIITDQQTGEVLETYYYTPVSSALRRLSEKLGKYMHAMKEAKAADDWWSEFRLQVERGALLLEEATSGTLLGPLLRQGQSNKVNLQAELLGSTQDPRSWPGRQVLIGVAYFASLAEAMHGDA